MKKMFLLQGVPGCGKSKFIKDNDLQDFTISSDEMKMLHSGLTIDVNGYVSPNQRNPQHAWSATRSIMENKAKRGELIILDATNLNKSRLEPYRQIANEYFYEVFLVRFDVSLQEAIRRNEKRSHGSTFLNNDVIKRMHKIYEEVMCDDNDNDFYSVITPDEASKMLSTFHWDREIDEKVYKEEVHVGDIHGMYDQLMDAIGGRVKDDTFYVFHGDYFDRGVDQCKVFKFIRDNIDRDNCVFLLGNHEEHFFEYFKDPSKPVFPKDFAETIFKLRKNNVSDEDMKYIIRKMKDVVVTKFKGNKTISTHGGISNPLAVDECFIKSEWMIPSECYIRGSGDYYEIEKVSSAFENQEFTQIFGHRNIEHIPFAINNKGSYLLIEHGGVVRSCTIVGPYKNNKSNIIFRESWVDDDPSRETFKVKKLLSSLNESPFIRSNSFEDTELRSYNFTRKAFDNKEWNAITVKARGLFINPRTCQIACRGWDKFFNIDENDQTSIDTLKRTLKYPIIVSKKENGYLGLIGYDSSKDELIIASKARIDGKHSDLFKDLVLSILSDEQIQAMTNIVRKDKITLLFEVMDPINDPHIIHHDKAHICLLDAVYNTANFKKKTYGELNSIANEIGGLTPRKIVRKIKYWTDLVKFIETTKKEDYKLDDDYIEGFVFEDSAGFMFKLKLPFYIKWKKMRSSTGYAKRTRTIKHPDRCDEEELSYLNFIISLPDDEIEVDNIIRMREKFYAKKESS